MEFIELTIKGATEKFRQVSDHRPLNIFICCIELISIWQLIILAWTSISSFDEHRLTIPENHFAMSGSAHGRRYCRCIYARFEFVFPLGLFDQFWLRSKYNLIYLYLSVNKDAVFSASRSTNLRAATRMAFTSVWILVFLAILQDWAIPSVTSTLIC